MLATQVPDLQLEAKDVKDIKQVKVGWAHFSDSLRYNGL